jgi:thiol-disulfide isomerase/thioredoxin
MPWAGWSRGVILRPMPGTGPTIDPRKLGAIAVLLGASGLIVALFIWMVPSAAAREVQAACNGMHPQWSNSAFRRLPTKAPDFALQDTDGKTVKLSDYQGKVVLVNFWASWCGVCKAEKKSLARITNDLAGNDFVVLSLSSDTEKAAVDESLRIALGGRNQPSKQPLGGAPFKVLLDPPANENESIGQTARAWGVEKVPDSFLVDRDGAIRMYLVNKRDWSSGVVETCVQSLIDE